MDQFLQLPTQEISNIYTLIKGNNTTMVFAYDGTRRSYLITEGLKNLNAENAGGASTTNCASNINNSNTNNSNTNNSNINNSHIKIDYLEYSKTAIHKFLNLSITMFQHGIKTIVYPMWFCTLEKRGPEYLPKFIQYLWGLSALLEDPNLAQQYKDNGVKVVFYGDYKRLLTRGNDNLLLDKFEKIMQLTKNNSKKLLLLGTNIEEPSQTIINYTLSYYKKFGKEPNKKDLIESYYGDSNIQDVSFYIGFDRFSTDGRPILISENGDEDLYYSVSPHSYFTTEQFRKVLYDHLYQRSCVNAKEYELKISDVETMKSFYDSNAGKIMGVGEIQKQGNYWYPSPQVVVPNISVKKSSSNTSISTSHVSTIKQKLLNNSNNSNGSINSNSKNNHLNLITKSIKKIDLNNSTNNPNNRININNNGGIESNSNNSEINSKDSGRSNIAKSENLDNIANISFQNSPTINSLIFTSQNSQMGSPPSPRYLNNYIAEFK